MKVAIAFSAVLSIAAVAAMAQQTVLKGNVSKDLEVKPQASLVDKYGEAAKDPAAADALGKAQGKPEPGDSKVKTDVYEALQSGVWKPGADPTMAIMNGYIPPNMSPEQAAIMAEFLPKMPKMPQRMSPEEMAGEPNPDLELAGVPEPMSPYVPFPDSVPTREPKTRQLSLIPKPLSQQFVGGPGMPVPTMGVPIMPYGAGTKAIAEANQRQLEDYLRDRLGPGYKLPVQGNHNRPTQNTKAAGRHIVESDHQSTVGVCDNNGNEITGIQYDPWGQPTVLHGGSVMPTFMYKGMLYHDRSQKYLTLNRVYDPAMGRWLTRDPLGEAAGTNLYAYCGNDPINRFDPFGLDYWLLHDTTALGSSASSGLGPFGHTGNLVGNPTTGYDYYSSSRDPNFQIARHFDTLQDVQNSGLMNRYSEAVYIPTTPAQDAAMSLYGSQNYNRFNIATNNCSNLSKGMMSAGGLPRFKSGFPSRPNALFGSVSQWSLGNGGALVNPNIGLMPEPDMVP